VPEWLGTAFPRLSASFISLFFLLVLHLFPNAAFAEDAVYCSTTDDIRLSTQAQIDGFQVAYGPCDTVQHSIAIGGSSSNRGTDTNINNLDGLAGIKEIQG